VAAKLRREFASDAEPVDVDRLAESLGCQLVPRGDDRRGSVIEATLRPRSSVDQFILEVNPVPRHGWGDLPPERQKSLARHRRRFRIAHEIGHTYFFDRKPGRGPRRKQPWTHSEENWCDGFARELLVSGRAVKFLPGTADSVFEVQGQFDVSLEVAARAVAAAHPYLDVALWFWTAEDDPVPTALVHQWSNRVTLPALRVWREGALVQRALSKGRAQGSAPDLRGRSGPTRGAARSDPQRRQLVVVGGLG
jgi:hypothetical protein